MPIEHVGFALPLLISLELPRIEEERIVAEHYFSVVVVSLQNSGDIPESLFIEALFSGKAIMIADDEMEFPLKSVKQFLCFLWIAEHQISENKYLIMAFYF